MKRTNSVPNLAKKKERLLNTYRQYKQMVVDQLAPQPNYTYLESVLLELLEI